jgi:hypothetical protein
MNVTFERGACFRHPFAGVRDIFANDYPEFRCAALRALIVRTSGASGQSVPAFPFSFHFAQRDHVREEAVGAGNAGG